MKPRNPASREPLVGIFWCEGSTAHLHAVPLSEGVPYGDCVNGPLDHVEFWPELERQHPHLRGREYFELPRGRVVFRRTQNRFAVLMDARLHTKAIKTKLVKLFRLPAGRYRFERDAHYTTDPRTLNRLMEA
jgi:hypothetical protein